MTLSTVKMSLVALHSPEGLGIVLLDTPLVGLLGKGIGLMTLQLWVDLYPSPFLIDRFLEPCDPDITANFGVWCAPNTNVDIISFGISVTEICHLIKAYGKSCACCQV